MKIALEKRKHNEIVKFYYYLNGCVATASMVERATNIKQKNICRYKRLLEKSGVLFQVYKTRCKVTGRSAWYITTNGKFVSSAPEQLNLFDY